MRNRKNIKLKNTSEQRNIKQSEESSLKISVVEREKRKKRSLHRLHYFKNRKII